METTLFIFNKETIRDYCSSMYEAGIESGYKEPAYLYILPDAIHQLVYTYHLGGYDGTDPKDRKESIYNNLIERLKSIIPIDDPSKWYIVRKEVYNAVYFGDDYLSPLLYKTATSILSSDYWKATMFIKEFVAPRDHELEMILLKAIQGKKPDRLKYDDSIHNMM